MEFDLETLSYNKILHMLSEQAVSDAAREELFRMTPLTSEPLCRARMAETTAARAVLEALGSPPLAQTAPLDEALSLAAQGAMLVPEQLSGVSRFASTVRSLRRYLQSSARCSAAIASMRVALPTWRGRSTAASTRTRCWTTRPPFCARFAASAKRWSRASAKS